MPLYVIVIEASQYCEVPCPLPNCYKKVASKYHTKRQIRNGD